MRAAGVTFCLAILCLAMFVAVCASQEEGTSNGIVIVFVAGVSRSGTSVTAGMMHQLGARTLDSCHVPGPLHPTGKFECFAVVKLNKDIMKAADRPWYTEDYSSLQLNGMERKKVLFGALKVLRSFIKAGLTTFSLKDPRFVWTLPLWLEAANTLQAQTVVVMVHRFPLDNVLSLEKHGAMLKAHQINPFNRWEGFMKNTLSTSCGSPHRVLLNYDGLNSLITRNETLDRFFHDLQNTPLRGRIRQTYQINALDDQYSKKKPPKSAFTLEPGSPLCLDDVPVCNLTVPESTVQLARHLEDRSILRNLCHSGSFAQVL